MGHLHQEPGEHDFTASAYIIRTDFDEPKLMLHKHKILEVFLQFGGHVEWKENPWQALNHELEEETGFRLNELKLVQPRARMKQMTGATLHPTPFNLLTHPFPDRDHHHTDISYLLVADHAPVGNVATGESDEFEYFSMSELKAVTSEQIPENVREIGLFALTLYDTLEESGMEICDVGEWVV